MNETASDKTFASMLLARRNNAPRRCRAATWAEGNFGFVDYTEGSVPGSGDVSLFPKAATGTYQHVGDKDLYGGRVQGIVVNSTEFDSYGRQPDWSGERNGHSMPVVRGHAWAMPKQAWDQAPAEPFAEGDRRWSTGSSGAVEQDGRRYGQDYPETEACHQRQYTYAGSVGSSYHSHNSALPSSVHPAPFGYPAHTQQANDCFNVSSSRTRDTEQAFRPHSWQVNNREQGIPFSHPNSSEQSSLDHNMGLGGDQPHQHAEWRNGERPRGGSYEAMERPGLMVDGPKPSLAFASFVGGTQSEDHRSIYHSLVDMSPFCVKPTGSGHGVSSTPHMRSPASSTEHDSLMQRGPHNAFGQPCQQGIPNATPFPAHVSHMGHPSASPNMSSPNSAGPNASNAFSTVTEKAAKGMTRPPRKCLWDRPGGCDVTEATHKTQWRKGPLGPSTLCNRHGLQLKYPVDKDRRNESRRKLYALKRQKKNLDAAAIAANLS